MRRSSKRGGLIGQSEGGRGLTAALRRIRVNQSDFLGNQGKGRGARIRNPVRELNSVREKKKAKTVFYLDRTTEARRPDAESTIEREKKLIRRERLDKGESVEGDVSSRRDESRS